MSKKKMHYLIYDISEHKAFSAYVYVSESMCLSRNSVP